MQAFTGRISSHAGDHQWIPGAVLGFSSLNSEGYSRSLVLLCHDFHVGDDSEHARLIGGSCSMVFNSLNVMRVTRARYIRAEMLPRQGLCILPARIPVEARKLHSFPMLRRFHHTQLFASLARCSFAPKWLKVNRGVFRREAIWEAN